MKIRVMISRAITVISVLLILGAVVILGSAAMSRGEEIPEIFGYSLMRVVTGSMEPELPTKSVVLVKRLDGLENPEEIQKKIADGDIISFYSPDPSLNGMVISHRVIGRETIDNQCCFYTKGDANPIEDAYPVPMSSVLGKVVWCSKSIGKVVSLLLNPLVFFPCIILPLLILIILNLRNSIQNIRKAATEEKEEAIREAIEAAKRQKEEDEMNRKED